MLQPECLFSGKMQRNGSGPCTRPGTPSSWPKPQAFTRSDFGSYIGFSEASAFTRVPMTSIS